MGLEDLGSCERKEKNPDLEIAQLAFLLTLPEYKNDQDKKTSLLKIITNADMAPYYEWACEKQIWKPKKKELALMKQNNVKILNEFDKEIEFATDNLSVIEVKEAYLNKANYLSKIGDKENTLKTLSRAYDKTVSLGYKLDNVFHCIRIGLFFLDLDLIQRNLQRSEDLLEQGADWHSRNCYQIYKGLYALMVRDFSTASRKFLDAVSTFTCTELISYEQFIKYTVLASMLTLNRSDLKNNIIDNPDILEVLHTNKDLKEYILSLYNCDYNKFFLSLAEQEKAMREDMFLHPHYKFYVREMKIKAYDQLLSTYISVSLSYMANQFGVSVEYIENDVSKLIATGRLNYKIDKVNETVVNIPSREKNEMYKSILKQGDLLLNRIHKLSRVINI